jgi:hypothetical protein
MIDGFQTFETCFLETMQRVGPQAAGIDNGENTGKKGNRRRKKGGSAAGGASIPVPQVASSQTASSPIRSSAGCSLNAIEPRRLNVGGEESPVCVGVPETAALGGLALQRQADGSSRVLSEPGSESLPTPSSSLNAPETDRSSSALSGPGSENLRTPRRSGYKFSSDSESLRTSWPSGYNDPDFVSKSSECRCLSQLILP